MNAPWQKILRLDVLTENIRACIFIDRCRVQWQGFNKLPVRKVISEHRTQERAIQTRKDLMAAARRVFARDGFEVARLQDIAQEAGKTRGALYAHFTDKEDLFFRCD